MDDFSDKGSMLFGPANEWGNAVLNFHSAPSTEFDIYAKRFHLAGRKLAQLFLSSTGFNDVDVCPIIFLYRHSVELYLKALIILGRNILTKTNNNPGEAINVYTNHRLNKLLIELKRILAKMTEHCDQSFDDLISERIEGLIYEFDRIDWGSYSFRYPVDTKGDASLPESFYIHIPTFCDHMDSMLDLFEAATVRLQEFRGNIEEANKQNWLREEPTWVDENPWLEDETKHPYDRSF